MGERARKWSLERDPGRLWGWGREAEDEMGGGEARRRKERRRT
jgi:hypothetical protein